MSGIGGLSCFKNIWRKKEGETGRIGKTEGINKRRNEIKMIIDMF